MKILVSILLLAFTTICFGQTNGQYSNFSSAFQHIDSVKSISINCMHNNMLRTDGCDSLPENLGDFSQLSSLEISESDITSLPKSINQLKRLKMLSLNALYYLDYTKELCKLKGLDSLEYLGLYRAIVDTLPTCIETITSLRSIDVSHILNLNIEKVFQIFKHLPNLESINIGGINSLSIIPNDIIEIKNLHSVGLDYLAHPHLAQPFDYNTSFERLSSLKIQSLTLRNNQLETLPTTITKLKDLTYIDVSENYFEQLPAELFELTNLKQIRIQYQNHSLQCIGSGIATLKKLEKINIAYNSNLDGIETIRTLSTLPALKVLDIGYCNMDSIPNEIKRFSVLEKLNIEKNPKINFSTLFTELSYLPSLVYLDIGNNGLTTLPKEIGLLTSLEYLRLGQNPIESFPEEFYSLQHLKILNIYGNYNLRANRISEKELAKIKEKLPNCKIINERVYID